jgi:predicted DNA-binding protein
MPSKGRQVQVSLYLSPELARRLKQLSEQTRISQAAYFREAIEDLLKKYSGSRQRSTR